MPHPASAPRPGEVYWVNLDPVVGSEQSGTRPALVISPEAIQSVLPVVVVAAITSQIKQRNSPIAPILAPGKPLAKESAVLTFQIRTIDKGRLGELAGALTDEQMAAVRRGIALVFGLR